MTAISNTYIYILKHFDTDIDNIRVFTNLDTALESLHQWLENDDYLLNYAISKYELANNGTEYEHVEDIDLDEFIDSQDEDEDEDDGESVIDSEDD